jgi:hypothetical protein
VVKFLTDKGLFIGQSRAFVNQLTALANQADSAQRKFKSRRIRLRAAIGGISLFTRLWWRAPRLAS